VAPNATAQNNVLRVLTWQDDENLHETLIASHRAILSSRFDQAISLFIQAGVGQQLSRILAELPAPSRDRVLTAPETVRRLLYEDSTDLVFFLNSLFAEGYRIQEGEFDVPEPVWTALGDSYFPAGCGSHNMNRSSSRCWQADKVYLAPSVGLGIPVDSISPYAMRWLASISTASIPLTTSEQAAAIEKLSEAISRIKHANSQAHRLICQYTRVIAPRSHPGCLSQFSSFSSERYIGRIGLANLHADCVDLATVMDSLVHESIHSFLYIIEEAHHFLLEPKTANPVTIVSPWSGRELNLHSLLHACLVWFGLFQFWKSVLCRSTGLSGAHKQFERSRRGFDRPELDSELRKSSPYLAPWCRTMLFELVQGIRRGIYD
jgi:hypothetical protein